PLLPVFPGALHMVSAALAKVATLRRRLGLLDALVLVALDRFRLAIVDERRPVRELVHGILGMAELPRPLHPLHVRFAGRSVGLPERQEGRPEARAAGRPWR